jgi:hypothetical protein
VTTLSFSISPKLTLLLLPHYISDEKASGIEHLEKIEQKISLLDIFTGVEPVETKCGDQNVWLAVNRLVGGQLTVYHRRLAHIFFGGASEYGI